MKHKIINNKHFIEYNGNDYEVQYKRGSLIDIQIYLNIMDRYNIEFNNLEDRGEFIYLCSKIVDFLFNISIGYKDIKLEIEPFEYSLFEQIRAIYNYSEFQNTYNKKIDKRISKDLELLLSTKAIDDIMYFKYNNKDVAVPKSTKYLQDFIKFVYNYMIENTDSSYKFKDITKNYIYMQDDRRGSWILPKYNEDKIIGININGGREGDDWYSEYIFKEFKHLANDWSTIIDKDAYIPLYGVLWYSDGFDKIIELSKNYMKDNKDGYSDLDYINKQNLERYIYE